MVPLLINERVHHDGEEVGLRHVMWDRGYSILDDARTHAPLRLAGIEPVFDLSTSQRKYQPTMEGVLWLDGQPFSIHVPERLRDLPRVGRNASAEERESIEALFNERARWRYSVLAGPDADGYLRMQCPFCAGRLRSRVLRQRKVARSAPLVDLPEDTTTCCDGVIRVEPALLRVFQAAGIPFGTTAWSTVYGWRNLVETGNCYLAGLYVDLSRKYTRLMGLAKRKFILAFLLAGANRYITTQWRRKKQEEARRAAEARKTRKRRRRPEDTLQGIVATAKDPYVGLDVDLEMTDTRAGADAATGTTPAGKARPPSRAASTRPTAAPSVKARRGSPGRSPVSRT